MSKIIFLSSITVSLIIRSAVTCGVPLIKLYLPFKPKYPFTAEGIGATKDNNEKLKSILGKLNNKAFIEKAPDNVIENFKIQEREMNSSIEKINEIINTIK